MIRLYRAYLYESSKYTARCAYILSSYCGLYLKQYLVTLSSNLSQYLTALVSQHFVGTKKPAVLFRVPRLLIDWKYFSRVSHEEVYGLECLLLSQSFSSWILTKFDLHLRVLKGISTTIFSTKIRI